MEKEKSDQKDSTVTKDNGVSKKEDGKLDFNYKLSPFQVIIELNDTDFDKLINNKFKKWTPEENDIFVADGLIKTCFENMKRGTVNYFLDKTIDDYNRQYVGFFDPNGDKIIWINCFKKTFKDYPDWKQKLVIAKGVGNNFFNLKVNITKNDYYDLKINDSN